MDWFASSRDRRPLAYNDEVIPSCRAAYAACPRVVGHLDGLHPTVSV